MGFLSLLVLHDKRKVKEQSLQEYFLHTFFSFQFHRHISFSPKYALEEQYKKYIEKYQRLRLYLFVLSLKQSILSNII